jgi:hypothetical protein
MTTLPVVAVEGTKPTILVSLQLKTAAPTPLNVIELSCCVDPKPVPEIVTSVLTGAEAGFNPVIVGAATEIVIVAVADFVGSAIEVAVTVTVGGLGTNDGAR